MAIGANIFAGADASVSSAPSSPDTVTAMYGPRTGGGRGALHPGTHFGLGLWGAVGGLAALVLIRWSLPR
ncbi:MAG TPA: hypothetical protein VMU09_04065 [Acidimicrobiales bacterium]|nr:hypothetical protein [Acidimicrobiales bacterium]